MELLLRQPEIGRLFERGSGYRRLRQASHLIYYRVGAGSLRIEHILHYHMDAHRHLS